MFVYPERMKANLDSTGGLVFSGQLLLDLVEHGVSREDAYRLVQGHAMRAWKEDLNFRELVAGDPNITKRVPAQVIERAFDLQRQLRNIDGIFAQVFPRKIGGKAGDNKSKSPRVTRTAGAARRRVRSKAS
jgi:adenylosuccinate lyase